jgi:hypothetical protein
LYEASNNGNQFVGDAQLNVLPASDKRYVAYALDQKISIAQRNENTNKLKGYSLNGPHLSSEYAYENMAVFTIKSTHSEPRDVVVEVPIQGGDWTLVTSPTHSAIGKTANAYRRNIVAAPKETIVVGVRQERTNVNIQHLQNFDAQTLRGIANNAQLAPAAKPVLEAVIALMDKRNEANAQRTLIDEQLRVGRDNQNRIRENLKSVPVKSDPHNRYMAELNKADAQDEDYQAQLKAVMLKKQATEGALRDYLATLK